MEDDLWVALEFQTRFAADRESGRPHGLAHYLAQFPGHEETIAREFLEIDGPADRGPLGSGADPPTQIGPYRIQAGIGRGGQGIVFEAFDERLERPVALKVLHGATDLDDAALSRFRREATVVSGLDHPGICTVYDFGNEGSVSWIAMRLVEGVALSEWLGLSSDSAPSRGAPTIAESSPPPTEVAGPARGRPPAPPFASERDRHRRVLNVVISAALALHKAHQAGVVHRDIKPANIMVDASDQAVLTDFGLARQLEAGHTLTRPGDLFGTPAYLAPEQVRASDDPVDQRADIWALGVVLYEGLAGTRPFRAATREGLHQAILGQTPRSPRRLHPLVSRDLEIVIGTALAKDPDRRYQTAALFAEDLRRVLAGQPIAARRPTWGERLWRWTQLNPGLAASLALTLLTLATGVVVSLRLYDVARREAADARSKGEEARMALATAHDEKARTARALAAYEQLADQRLAAQRLEEIDSLYPIAPHRVPGFERWLAGVDRLLSREPLHRAARDKLERQRLPHRTSEETSDRGLFEERYPDFYRELERLLRSQRDLKQLVGTGELEPEDPALARVERELAALREDPRYVPLATAAFEDRRDAWRFDALGRLLGDLDRLRGARPEVAKRLEQARSIAARVRSEGAAAWERCRAALRESELYGRLPIPVQPGLVPLGKDERSGLWEFWHAPSGDRPRWTGTLEAGRAQVEVGSGLVFVLIPGGCYRLGAQREDEDAPHHDPEAKAFEGPVHEVTLDPWLLSKFEMTQDQYERAMGNNPSFYPPGLAQGEHTTTKLHPIEHLSYAGAREVVFRLGLRLPTEAQWEAAARAGTATPFHTGPTVASLQGYANISDRTVEYFNPAWESNSEVEDGYTGHAPVGQFAPNAFGLHDMHGNIWELCRGKFARYTVPARPRDGLRNDPGQWYHVVRGGCYRYPALAARSSARQRVSGDSITPLQGLRPALQLRLTSPDG